MTTPSEYDVVRRPTSDTAVTEEKYVGVVVLVLGIKATTPADRVPSAFTPPVAAAAVATSEP